jgi:hypothetical protein
VQKKVNAEDDSNNEGFQNLFFPEGKIFFINVFVGIK